MLSTPYAPPVDPREYNVEWSFWDEARRQIDIVEKGAFQIRGNNSQGFLDVRVSEQVADLIQRSAEFRVLIAFPRVVCGIHAFSHQPSEMDLAMISSAFRHCIS